MSENKSEAKKIRVYMDNELHIKLRAALEKHQLTMSGFLRACSQALVDENPIIEDFVSHFKDTSENHSKRNNSIIKKDKEKGEQLMKEFGFDDSEIEDLFDLIADQHPEI